jgi:hypothetical protein
MHRAGLAGLLGLALTCSCWEPSPAQTASADAAWAACTGAPKRACVLDHARHLAQSIESAGTLQSVDALQSVAEAQTKAGLPNEATTTFGLAVQAAQSISDGVLRAAWLIPIAKAQAAAGLNGEADATLGKALQIARSVEFEMTRNDLLGSVARMQADAGHVAEALDILQSIINDQWRRSGVLIAVAQAQGKAGMMREATATYDRAVQEFRSGHFWAIGRSAILVTIGNAQAKAGLLQEAAATFDEARRIAWSIKDESPRRWENLPFAGPAVMCVEALGDVAIAQAKAGLSHEATTTFDQAHLVALSIKSDVDRRRCQGMLCPGARVKIRA